MWISRRRPLVAALIGCALLLGSLLAAGPASAAPGHPVLRTFSTGPNSAPRGVAVDGSGNVYTLDVGAGRLDKFDAAGNRSSFSTTARYVGEASLTGSPERPFEFAGWLGPAIAVDRSGGPNDGRIYMAVNDNSGIGDVFVFAASGAYVGRIGPHNSGGNCAAAVNQSTGDFYDADTSSLTIKSFGVPAGDLGGLAPKAALSYPTCSLAVDSAGNVYAGAYPFFGPVPAKKFEPSQFGSASPTAAAEYGVNSTAVAVDSADNLYVDEGNQLLKFNAAGVQQGSAFGALNSSAGVATDASGNVVATDNNGGVYVYGPNEVALPKATTEAATNITTSEADVEGTVDPDGAGAITGCQIRYGEDSGYSTGSVPCTPGGAINSATAVTAHLSGLASGVTYRYRVFVTNANGTQMAGDDESFTTTANAVEAVATAPATEVAKDRATLNGSYTGDGSEAHYFFDWGATTAYGHQTAAPPGPSAGSGTGPQTVAPVQINGLHASTPYHYRLVVTGPNGTSRGGDEIFVTPEAVTNLTADPVTDVTGSSARLHGSFDGDSTYPTDYFYEWGPTLAYGNKAPAGGGTVAAGGGRLEIPEATISGLTGGLTYHYRVAASNVTGTSYSADASFKTAEAPLVSNLNSRNIQATSAELTGEINPRYGNTTWHFEWGPTAAYGNQAPLVDGDAGSGNASVPVSAQITGLTPGVTYHFRLVAKNQYGTSTSADQTLGFYPPACPNAQLRQETRANSLPDCRAYELVSPSFAQGAIIFPLGGPPAPLATNPSRLAYAASFGTFAEDTGDPGNIIGDLYVSTRSDTGWYQKFNGLPVTQNFLSGSPPRNYSENFNQSQFGPSRWQMGDQANPSLSRVISYNQGWPDVTGLHGAPSNAPYVWDTASGALVERWPTNLAATENGLNYVGVPEASDDFNHFVFQSNIPFAPGGTYVPRTIGCCETAFYEQVPPASIYDNDLRNRTVRLASIKEDGSTFQGHVFDISEDGSRILMAEERATVATNYLPPGANELNDVQGPFYLRVDGQRTYDIAAGHKLTYLGSTADGQTIYFRSKDKLSAEDKDTSTDIYRWRESEPGSLELISLGDHGNAGNESDCGGISWNGGGCNIEAIDFVYYSGATRKIEGFNAGQGGNGVTDSTIASKSGDVYFISPEALLSGKGEAGQANLYLWRKGTLRFVVALDPQKVCTTLELTSACATGPVARMQVNPDGTHMAFVAQSKVGGYNNNGKTEMYSFDPESGRVNCVSCRPDGLPPTSEVLGSQNGLFQTYDGRVFFSTEDPLVARDTNGVEDVYEYTEGRAQLISAGTGSSLRGFNGYQGLQTATGLVSVSANGTDVYFSTLDALVTQDHNGAAIKIYDARTGGGFPAERTPADCPSADECHGPGAAPLALPPDRTSAFLGNPKKKAAHKKHKHKKHQHKKKNGKKRGQAKSGKGSGKAKGKTGRSHRG